jgi:hypothetical protein
VVQCTAVGETLMLHRYVFHGIHEKTEHLDAWIGLWTQLPVEILLLTRDLYEPEILMSAMSVFHDIP